MRQVLPIVVLLGALNVLATAHQQFVAPQFEVASIKLWQAPTTSPTGVVGRAPVGSGIFNRATTVAGLIT